MSEPLPTDPASVPCTTTLGFPNVPEIMIPNRVASFATADVDGDGLRDVVFADDYDIHIANGKGNGTYETPATVVATLPGQGLRAVLVADMSGDGNADVVYSGFNDTSLHVATNTGALTFAAPVAYDMTLVPEETELRDINGDGRVDLVALNTSGHAVMTRLATPTGFAAAVQFTTSPDNTAAYRFALQDFTGDGKPDAVITAQTVAGFYVLVNNGAGAFGAPTFHAAVAPTYDVALADVNTDGARDIVLTHYNDSRLGVLLNNGTGTFATEMTYATGQNLAIPDLAMGDIDGDNQLDVVLTNGTSTDKVVIMFGGATGTFGSPVVHPAPPTTNVSLADMNADNKLDILIASGGRVSTWLHTTSSPWFQTRHPFAFGSGDHTVQAARFVDIDNATGPDLVGAYFHSGGTLGGVDVQSDMAGSYAGTPTVLDTPGDPRRMITGDVNGDMRADVIVLARSQQTGIVGEALLNQNGALTPAASFPVVTQQPIQVQATDVNEDGKLDLLLATSDKIDLHLGNGDGTFAAATTFWSGSMLVGFVAADFDRDGHVDFVVDRFNEGWGVLEFHKGTGGGMFAAPQLTPMLARIGKLATRDLNHDGRLDLIESPSNAALGVRLGHGDGTFGDALESNASPSTEVDFADVNGDGNTDVLGTAADFKMRSLIVWLGNGDGTLQPARYFDAGDRLQTLSVADVDGDGRLDVATESSLTISVLNARCLP